MISIITPDRINPQTGGQKYNYQLYDIIQKNVQTNELYMLLDEDIPKRRLSVLYNWEYLKQIKKLNQRVLLFDSRMFPRLVLFLIIFRILSPKTCIVTTHHHFYYKTRNNFISKWIVYVFEKLILGMANEVIVPSKYTMYLTLKMVNKSNVRFLPLGFDSIGIHSKEKELSEPIHLLNVGTICQRKRTSMLVDVMAQLPKGKFKMHIVGGFLESDPYYKNLMRKIKDKELGNDVLLYGRLEDDELDEMYKNASLFTFTSHYEGFGMVLVEAMLQGLPVIAFNNSAIPYVVKEGETGLLAKEGDIKDFVCQIKTLCSDDKLYRKMSQSACAHARSFPDSSDLECQMKEWIINKKQNL